MSLNIPNDLRKLMEIQLSEEDQWTLLTAAGRIEQLEQDVKVLKEKALRNSWEGQVDRQGGSFTQDEIDGFDGWGRI